MWNWTDPLMNTSSVNPQNAVSRFNYNADATQAAAKAGLIAAMMPTILAYPITSAASMAGGTVGGKAVDTGMKFATGKTWAQYVHDTTGMNENLAELSNFGIWGGGLFPFATKASRLFLSTGDQIAREVAGDVYQHGPTAISSLLSAGSQILGNATKDVIHYGPVAVIRNREGWFRPYVDQVRNGYQGWKDAQTVIPD